MKPPAANNSKEAIALRREAVRWARHASDIAGDEDDRRGRALNRRLLNAAMAYTRRAVIEGVGRVENDRLVVLIDEQTPFDLLSWEALLYIADMARSAGITKRIHMPDLNPEILKALWRKARHLDETDGKFKETQGLKGAATYYTDMLRYAGFHEPVWEPAQLSVFQLSRDLT